MPGPIVKPSPYIEPDVPPVPEPRGPLPTPDPDSLPKPEPGVPPREPATPKPGDPVPRTQGRQGDRRSRIGQGQPEPAPPTQPTPPPRPESVPPQPGRPMEDPMAPKAGP